MGEGASAMRRLWRIWVGYLEARRRYHRDDAHQIAANNLRTLNKVTPLTFLLLAVFLLATPYLIPGWTPSVWHLAFIPATIILAAITLFYAWKGKERANVATALCVLYEVVLFAGIIAIDAPGTAEAPGSFLSMLCVIMPVLFTLPFWLTFALIGLAVAGFCALTVAFKTAFLARYDIFEAIVAVFFALAVDALISALRIRDYEARMRYKLLSTRDAFSGVLNKRACEEATVNYLRACAPKVKCVFIIVDLDDFKQINDTHGHLVGDEILRRMNRRYTAEEYKALIADARKKMPDITLSSDIIVGFPGETEEDFEQTLALVREVRFDLLFTFLYSPRSGTPAASYEDNATHAEKQARFERLLKVQDEIVAERQAAYQGKRLRLLVDGEAKGPDYPFTARTEGNLLVCVRGEDIRIGEFIEAEIEKTTLRCLFARKI